jgi:hypothetical protein
MSSSKWGEAFPFSGAPAILLGAGIQQRLGRLNCTRLLDCRCRLRRTVPIATERAPRQMQVHRHSIPAAASTLGSCHLSRPQKNTFADNVRSPTRGGPWSKSPKESMPH